MGCAVISSVRKDRFSFGQKGNRASLQKDSFYGKHHQLGLQFAATTMRGWRDRNQDTYFLETKFTKTFFENKICLFAVFDGHGGGEVSNFAKKHIYEILIQNIFFQQGKFQKVLESLNYQIDVSMISEEGQKKIEIIQGELLAKNQNFRKNDATCERTGSTSVIVLVSDKNVYIANAGDSKAVALNSDGTIILETQDHRIDSLKEKQRILSLGGEIKQQRIDGNLNVTRGLGDFLYKNMNLSQKSLVSSSPEIHVIPRDNISHIILGSDGIWQEKDTQGICDNILRKVKQTGSLLDGIQSNLNETVSISRQNRYGMDNMTQIVIYFPPSQQQF